MSPGRFLDHSPLIIINMPIWWFGAAPIEGNYADQSLPRRDLIKLVLYESDIGNVPPRMALIIECHFGRGSAGRIMSQNNM